MASVQEGVWLLAGLALAEQWRTGRSLLASLRANRLMVPLAMLAAAIGVSTFTAVDWRLSLWGSYERGQEAATLLTYLLLCYLAAGQLRSSMRAWRIAQAMALTGGPIVLFGLAQAAGWSPFNVVSDARSPIYATLGRANFVGSYLALLTPLSLALFLRAETSRGRTGWAALLMGEVLVVGLSLARGAWLAAAVGLSIVALGWWRPSLSSRLRRLAWGGVALLSVSGPIAVLWVGATQTGSTAARVAIWQGSLTLLGRRPMLGYGADSLTLTFPQVYPPGLVYDLGRDFVVDRAHNLFLDWGLTAGLFGLMG